MNVLYFKLQPVKRTGSPRKDDCVKIFSHFSLGRIEGHSRDLITNIWIYGTPKYQEDILLGILESDFSLRATIPFQAEPLTV